MVSSIEQKVEYLNKLLDNNSETAKTLKDTLERLDVFYFFIFYFYYYYHCYYYYYYYYLIFILYEFEYPVEMLKIYIIL